MWTGNQDIDDWINRGIALLTTGGGLVVIRKKIKEYLNTILSTTDRLDALEAQNVQCAKDRVEHKQAIEDIKIETMLLMGFLNASDESFIVFDTDCKTMMVSGAFCKLTGLQPDEARNGAWKELIHDEDRLRALNLWEMFVKGGRWETVIKFRFVYPSDDESTREVIRVSMKLSRIKLGAGATARIMAIVCREEHDTREIPVPPILKQPKKGSDK